MWEVEMINLFRLKYYYYQGIWMRKGNPNCTTIITTNLSVKNENTIESETSETFLTMYILDCFTIPKHLEGSRTFLEFQNISKPQTIVMLQNICMVQQHAPGSKTFVRFECQNISDV
jgi:hypothetical protein